MAFDAQGVRTPSSRFRVQQLRPALTAAGLGCTVYAANPSNQGETWWTVNATRPAAGRALHHRLDRIAHDLSELEPLVPALERVLGQTRRRFQLLQYMALGVPVVANPEGVTAVELFRSLASSSD